MHFLVLHPILQNREAAMDEPCVSHGSPQRCRDTQGQRQARPGTIKCGWLRKQGGFVKTWHSRWFVLRGEQLHYYKDEEETKALVKKPTHHFTVENFILNQYLW